METERSAETFPRSAIIELLDDILFWRDSLLHKPDDPKAARKVCKDMSNELCDLFRRYEGSCLDCCEVPSSHPKCSRGIATEDEGAGSEPAGPCLTRAEAGLGDRLGDNR